jgi:hypothetical protein
MLFVLDPVTSTYIPFLCAKEMRMKITPELINVTTLSSGDEYEYRPRRFGREMTISGISTILGDGWTVFKTIEKPAMKLGYNLRMTFEDRAGNTAMYSGKAFLKEADLGAPQDVWSDYDLSFVLSGTHVSTVDATHTDPLPSGTGGGGSGTGCGTGSGGSGGGVPTTEEVFSDWFTLAEGGVNIPITQVSEQRGYTLTDVTFEGVLEVDREGTEYDVISAAPTSGGRDVHYDETTGLSFADPANTGGERVFVLFKKLM